ncbi:unnamed protein product [Paramecium sonneborni]|uniref:Uncharacterized protein n=1 Tax=Paramecium sonneborni TaxID=65129 RepID=A0A8S1K7V1_9CILI|nr:unnamed protein product [Paramecium sonneborni]
MNKLKTVVGILYNVQNVPEMQLATQFSIIKSDIIQIILRISMNYQYMNKMMLKQMIEQEDKYLHNSQILHMRNSLLHISTLRVIPEDLEIPKVDIRNINVTSIDWRCRGSISKIKDNVDNQKDFIKLEMAMYRISQSCCLSCWFHFRNSHCQKIMVYEIGS